MWLSRLTLDPRRREVQRDLADVHALHRRVMAAFPSGVAGEDPRRALGVLHRLDVSRTGAVLLLVQSSAPPAPWTEVLPPGYLFAGAADGGASVRDGAPILSSAVDGAVFAFRLRANPTKRIHRVEPGGRLQKGARVGLRALPEQLAWLRRKAEAHGFELPVDGAGVPVVVDQEHGTVFGRGRGLVFDGVTFEGRLAVRDAARFREALVDGIGSGKAFGFGLLTIARTGAAAR